MDQPKATRTVTVASPEGLHARAALLVFNLARSFQAKIEIVMDQQRANASEMLHLLSLGAGQGQSLTIEAVGPDAEAAVEAMAQLFATGLQTEDNSAQSR